MLLKYVKKVTSRLYFLKQLKRANIPIKDLLIFYLTCIRPVTEYACPAFHNALSAVLEHAATEARLANYFSVCSI